MTRLRAAWKGALPSIEQPFWTHPALIHSGLRNLINDGGIPLSSLDKVAELAGLDTTSLCLELSVFARRYESLCNTLREEFSIVPCESERESADEPLPLRTPTTTDV